MNVSIVHEIPTLVTGGRRGYEGLDETPCCWRDPRALPHDELMTAHVEDVTCRRIEPTAPGVPSPDDAVVHLMPKTTLVVPVMECCGKVGGDLPGELMSPYGLLVTCPGQGRNWVGHPLHPSQRGE